MAPFSSLEGLLGAQQCSPANATINRIGLLTACNTKQAAARNTWEAIVDDRLYRGPAACLTAMHLFLDAFWQVLCCRRKLYPKSTFAWFQTLKAISQRSWQATYGVSGNKGIPLWVFLLRVIAFMGSILGSSNSWKVRKYQIQCKNHEFRRFRIL